MMKLPQLSFLFEVLLSKELTNLVEKMNKYSSSICL
jgi:hypothetical protein